MATGSYQQAAVSFWSKQAYGGAKFTDFPWNGEGVYGTANSPDYGVAAIRFDLPNNITITGAIFGFTNYYQVQSSNEGGVSKTLYTNFRLERQNHLYSTAFTSQISLGKTIQLGVNSKPTYDLTTIFTPYNGGTVWLYCIMQNSTSPMYARMNLPVITLTYTVNTPPVLPFQDVTALMFNTKWLPITINHYTYMFRKSDAYVFINGNWKRSVFTNKIVFTLYGWMFDVVQNSFEDSVKNYLVIEKDTTFYTSSDLPFVIAANSIVLCRSLQFFQGTALYAFVYYNNAQCWAWMKDIYSYLKKGLFEIYGWTFSPMTDVQFSEKPIWIKTREQIQLNDNLIAQSYTIPINTMLMIKNQCYDWYQAERINYTYLFTNNRICWCRIDTFYNMVQSNDEVFVFIKDTIWTKTTAQMTTISNTSLYDISVFSIQIAYYLNGFMTQLPTAIYDTASQNATLLFRKEAPPEYGIIDNGDSACGVYIQEAIYDMAKKLLVEMSEITQDRLRALSILP